jgi:hypothetical protein
MQIVPACQHAVENMGYTQTKKSANMVLKRTSRVDKTGMIDDLDTVRAVLWPLGTRLTTRQN